MNASGAQRSPLYWAGVALGPAAWAINGQAIYALTPQACSGAAWTTIVLAIVLAVIAAAGTLISLRAVDRDAQAEWTEAQGGWARNFMAWLGVGSGVLFALVILNQLAATLLISPCSR
jgi:hypothetical protein